ncbi:hypothetical protein [Macrococcus equi]|uniref:hypothetical protein n=1 Tax=Macrococcus equi TaxID=3395462 RepID=UPI0039BE9219
MWKYELDFNGKKVKYTRYNQVKTPLVELQGYVNFKDKTIEFDENDVKGLNFRINGDIITTKDSVGDTLKYHKKGSSTQLENEKEYEKR